MLKDSRMKSIPQRAKQPHRGRYRRGRKRERVPVRPYRTQQTISTLKNQEGRL